MATDLVNRIGGARAALAIKAPCRVATTANITLSGLQTIDGVTVVADERVLVKDQTTASENGIYLAKTTAWTRAVDFDGNDDIVKGTQVYVHSGTVGSGQYEVISSDPITIGSSPITFSQISVYQNSSDVAALTTRVDAVETTLGGTQLSNLLSVSGTGIVSRTGSDTYDQRIISSSGSTLDVTNGDGVSGNPDLDVADNAITLAKLAHGTANKYIGFDSSGAPAEVAQVQRSDVTLIGTTPDSSGLVRNWVVDNTKLFSAGDAANSQNGYNGDTAQPIEVVFNVSHGNLTKVICGAKSTYVLDASGYVYSFGGNVQGQLGHGDTTNRQVATRIEYFVTNSITISDIYVNKDSAGALEYVFFKSSTGTIYACGNNSYGQLGLGDTTDRTTPTLSSITGVSSVACSGNQIPFALIVKTDGTIYAAGYNGTGNLGLGHTTTPVTTSTEVTGVTGVSKAECCDDATVGGTSYVLKTSGTIWSAGYNGVGQLGLGDTINRSSFVQIGTATDWTDIKCGAESQHGMAAALNASGQIYTWGYNVTGALGDGSTTNRSSPVLPTGSFQTKVSSIACAGGTSYRGTVLLTTDGQIWSTGYNGQGNLGIGSTVDATSFTQTVGLTATVSNFVVSGSASTWGITVLYSDGSTAVCGDNSQGQLGLDTGVVDALVFYPVTSLTPLGVQGLAGPSYNASSTTSLTVGTSSKAFTLDASGYAFVVGSRIRAASAANPTLNYMEGIVTAYSGLTLTVTIDNIGGSGTLADWNIGLAGDAGITDTLINDINGAQYSISGVTNEYIDKTATSYTLQGSDTGNVLTFNSSTDVAITVPNSLPVGFNATIIQLGTGQAVFSAGAGATLHNRQGHDRTHSQYAMAVLAVYANSGGSSAIAVLGGDTYNA